jgi:hypothetical protein
MLSLRASFPWVYKATPGVAHGDGDLSITSVCTAQDTESSTASVLNQLGIIVERVRTARIRRVETVELPPRPSRSQRGSYCLSSSGLSMTVGFVISPEGFSTVTSSKSRDGTT